MKRSYILLLLVSLLAVASCKKDDKYVHATIVDTGDITYIGCGYLLKLDDNALLKPLYLPGAFQHDGLSVKIQYEHTGLADTCNYGQKLFDQVSVSDIKLVNE